MKNKLLRHQMLGELEKIGIKDRQIRKELLRVFGKDSNLMSLLNDDSIIQETLSDKLGFGKSTLKSIQENISNRTFIEIDDVLESFRLFITSNYKNLDLVIYHFDKDSNCLEYIGGNQKYKRKINLNNMKEDDYLNEKRSINSEQYQHTSGQCGIGGCLGGKAAIRLDLPGKPDIILSFIERDPNSSFKNTQKDILKLGTLFSNGLLKALLNEKFNYITAKYQDPLTKLYNKAYINEICNRSPYSLVMIDINDFKRVNDTYGHRIGDEILIDLSKKVQKAIRREDRACRYGGDELLILVDSDEEDVLEKMKKRLLEAIHNDNQNKEDSHKYTVTIGYKIFDRNLTFADIIDIADKNMHEEKGDSGSFYRLIQDINDINTPGKLKELLKLIEEKLKEYTLN